MKNNSNSESGFVLVIALMLLLVTTLMGTTLIISATNQSKVVRENQQREQSFLGSESGIQASIKYLNKQITDNNDYMVNGSSTFNSICNYPLSNYYQSADLPFKYAYKTPSSISLSTEMELGNDAIYNDQQYDYYLTVLGATSGIGSGAGGSVGEGSEYSGVGAANATEYRVLSCGSNSTSRSRSIVEVILEAN